MDKQYTYSLFIFRRDLRLTDNTGLLKALESSRNVIAAFIINPEQAGASNSFRSEHALQFMAQSLENLDDDLRKQGSKLHLFSGTPLEVLTKLCSSVKIDAIFINKDYTPYSRARDSQIEAFCNSKGIDFISCSDVLLHEPEEGVSKRGKPFQIFTPFFTKNRTLPIALPQKPDGTYATLSLHYESTRDELALFKKCSASIDGGRSAALLLLSKIPLLTDYETTHDFPEYQTSGLSAHLKFGTISIRECYHSIKHFLGIDHPLIRQLFWRDFFYHLQWFHPSVFGHPYYEKFERLAWNTDEKIFKKWCNGETGFPIVDAGMRQLNQTGYMHNRVRLIAASFLVKDLHIHWLWGEKYFAQKLTDYDPAINNGNWQWVASTGCDHQPYFRIFNPWLQQKKFDPMAHYIKTWVPELKSVEPAIIHQWDKQKIANFGYPSPVVDHYKEAALSRELYKMVEL